MKASLFDFFSEAFSTIFIILEAVDSPKLFCTLTVSTPDMLTHPDTIWSPLRTSRGILSPVSATVLSADVPSTISPSSATRSPGFTMMVSPTAIVSGLTV